MLNAGVKVNVIPTVAEAQIDVRRLPTETRQEVIERFRQIVNDPAVEIQPAGGVARPATEPSSRTSALYLAMEQVLRAQPGNPVVLPMMIMGATDGAELRARGMGVYGIPLFPTAASERRAHGNDERVHLEGFTRGVGLLRAVVRKVAE
jgi:carboxypeptidase PM20D1